MRDYKKGKYLLETRPGQLLPITTSKDKGASTNAEQQQKRILEKVWANVEKAMAEMRAALIAQLQDPARSVEEQERTLEYVLEKLFTQVQTGFIFIFIAQDFDGTSTC